MELVLAERGWQPDYFGQGWDFIDAERHACPTQLSYDSPVVTSAQAVFYRSSSEASTFTVNGVDFGEAKDDSRELSVGSLRCADELWIASTSLRCSVSGEVDASKPLRVGVTIRGSVGCMLQVFTYQMPSISLAAAINSPPCSAVSLTLQGTLFDRSDATPSVMLAAGGDGRTCQCLTTSWTSGTSVACATMQIPVTTVALLAGHTAASLPFGFRIDAPVLSQVTPGNFPVTGGFAALSLDGMNFLQRQDLLDGAGKQAWLSDTSLLLSSSDVAIDGPSLREQMLQLGLNVAFDGPVVSDILPVNFPRSGGVSLTIGGLNFEPSSLYRAVSREISCLRVSWVSTTSSTCFAEPSAPRLTSDADGRTFSFSFDSPVVSALVPANAPKAGGSLLTVFGANYGSQTPPTVGAPLVHFLHAACGDSKWVSDTSLSCILQSSSGSAVDKSVVSVEVASLSTTAAIPFRFDSVYGFKCEPFGECSVTCTDSDIARAPTMSRQCLCVSDSGETVSPALCQSLNQPLLQALCVPLPGACPPLVRAAKPSVVLHGGIVTLFGSNFGRDANAGVTVYVGQTRCLQSNWISQSLALCVGVPYSPNPTDFFTVESAGLKSARTIRRFLPGAVNLTYSQASQPGWPTIGWQTVPDASVYQVWIRLEVRSRVRRQGVLPWFDMVNMSTAVPDTAFATGKLQSVAQPPIGCFLDASYYPVTEVCEAPWRWLPWECLREAPDLPCMSVGPSVTSIDLQATVLRLTNLAVLKVVGCFNTQCHDPFDATLSCLAARSAMQDSSSSLGLIIGLVVANVFTPGAGVHANAATLDAKAVAGYTKAAQGQTTAEFLLHIIPNTFVGAFAEGEILQVLLLAVLFGIALGQIGEHGRPVLNLINEVSRVIFGIVSMVTKLAPVAAFGAMAFTIGKYGLRSLVSLGALMACVYVTCALFIFVVLGLIARFNGFSVWKIIKYIREELLIVVGTSSSETALPGLMHKMEKAGCARPVVGIVVPSGYSFNLDGTSIYLTMAALFVAQATDTPLTLWEQGKLLLVLMITSKGAAGVTGSGFITLAATLAATDKIPVAGMALILGVDRFMSEARAITNFIGNAVATLIVAKWDGSFDATKGGDVLAGKQP